MDHSQEASTDPASHNGHHRNGRFFNPGVPPQRFSLFLRWIARRKVGPWPAWIPSEPGPPPPASVAGPDLRATFVNHSTVLLQTHGLNFLTDPVWSERVSPFAFAGPRRHRAPGIRFEDLPPIHAVLLSHNHYDHMDLPTLRRVVAGHRPAIFCPLGLAGTVRDLGFTEVYELDWWQSQTWRGIPIHCVPAQHFSARTPFDRNTTLWCGWMLAPSSGNIYFAGDTGFGDLFGDIAARFAPLRFALLPIGAYEPEWFMGPIHMTPEQALDARTILRASVSMAIHFGAFSLADDSLHAPIERLRTAIGGNGHAQPFWVLQEGESRLVP
jgi:L-ascorbate metabolism protein UlaG (beta-lactamase superfamily)